MKTMVLAVLENINDPGKPYHRVCFGPYVLEPTDATGATEVFNEVERLVFRDRRYDAFDIKELHAIEVVPELRQELYSAGAIRRKLHRQLTCTDNG